MLRGMRNIGQSLIGKTIFTVLFGILIVSFAIWGIGDIFRATPRSTVARIGHTDITIEQYRTAFNNELQRLGRQFRTIISPEQARLYGIDQQVLNTLISEAVLTEQAKKLGLSVSDQTVARAIVDDPNFKGADGQFNRALFDQVLRNASLSEAGFVNEQRAAMTRIHLGEAIAGDLNVPVAAREALNRYTNEKRAASYVVLSASMAGDIPAPTNDQLQTFFNERKGSFQAPEYRALALFSIDASTVAKPETVSDADARQRYEQEKAKFGTPERRTIQQIAFPSQEEAEAAFSKIKEGATFDAIAAERNVSQPDLDLGTFTKSEMLDPAVADAAFSLAEGATSGPVAGRFGPVIVRVTKVQPESVRPFEEVAGEIRQEIAQSRAQEAIEKLHDSIEDARAGARPLADIAKEKGLTLVQIPAADSKGLDKSGKPVDLPERDALLKAAYASDIGVDNEPVRAAKGGYVWYDVTGIEPTRAKTLDEVRDQVATLWREDEIAQRLSEKARQLTERVEKGETLEVVAQELGAPVKAVTDLARNAAKDDLTSEAVNRIFSIPVGKAGNTANGTDARAIFKVTSATVPPLVTTTQEAQRFETQLRNSMSDDLINQYIAQARQDLGVTINQQALRQATGGEL
ncbi:SurA N-terminal domain-containing protein [Microvirga terricola]|uniref:Parvulin-like PPIase n=1 Tax=Microvirga terricola TaxID=2719797 RepID=A0ABX0VBD7_9HYPH|nr:SurA N-terminal domain-containing protein [Microvirga terricola]NIX77168.1 peptidylprolyl isomerase [Microvirga terricola]